MRKRKGQKTLQYNFVTLKQKASETESNDGQALLLCVGRGSLILINGLFWIDWPNVLKLLLTQVLQLCLVGCHVVLYVNWSVCDNRSWTLIIRFTPNDFRLMETETWLMQKNTPVVLVMAIAYWWDRSKADMAITRTTGMFLALIQMICFALPMALSK